MLNIAREHQHEISLLEVLLAHDAPLHKMTMRKEIVGNLLR